MIDRDQTKMDKIISALIRDDFEYLMNEGGFEYFETIMREGSPTYDDQEYDSLIEEFESRGLKL